MAAPSAGAILSDLGAEVIKVEPPKGDPVRGLARQPKVAEGQPTLDAGFFVDNRGKRSAAIAIDTPEGAELVRSLISEADIFLTNLLIHRQERYGLDAESLKATNDSLVHATLTGYGVSGPEATRPGYDVTAFFGRTAITDSITDPDSPPPRAPTAQGDHTTGLAMVAAILAALRLVEQGAGFQTVDVSLMGTALWTLASDIAPALVDRRKPTVRDRRHQINALANRYPCSDGRWVILLMPESRWWPRFCDAVGHPELGQDPRYDSPKKRFEVMPELVDRIDEIMKTKTAKEWGEIFESAGLIWGPIQSLPEVVDDPQVRSVGSFIELDHPDGEGTFETLAIPIRIEGADIAPRGNAPGVGEHTDAVLSEVGLSPERLAQLRQAGVVGNQSES